MTPNRDAGRVQMFQCERCEKLTFRPENARQPSQEHDLVGDDLRHRVINITSEQERIADLIKAARIASMCPGSM
jgi:hypothetical protein